MAGSAAESLRPALPLRPSPEAIKHQKAEAAKNQAQAEAMDQKLYGVPPDPQLLTNQQLYGVEHGKVVTTDMLEDLLRARKQPPPEGSHTPSPSKHDCLGRAFDANRRPGFIRAIGVLGGNGMGEIRKIHVLTAAAELFLDRQPPLVPNGSKDFVDFVSVMAQASNIQKGDAEGYKAFCGLCVDALEIRTIDGGANPARLHAFNDAFQETARQLSVRPFSLPAPQAG